MAFIDNLLPAPVNGGFAMDDYWVWGGSAIQGEDGQFHLFAARWPKALPFFDGYKVCSEVVRATAPAPAGPYTFQEVVLPARGPQHWDGQMTHNPTVHKVGPTYLLFYIGATYPDPRPTADELWAGSTPKPNESYATIRIGLATAPSVLGPWGRPDAPILAPRPGKWDDKVVTNPAACVLPDRSILLLYRSNTPEGLRIGGCRAEHFAGPYGRIHDDPVLQLEGGSFVEDPYLWHNGDRFEMVAKDMTGGLTGEKHAGIHATSPDGLSWRVSDPAKAYSRRVRWDDGSETVQGCVERPQLLIEDGRPTHLFAATADGPGGFRNCSRSWNMVVPIRRD